jgi:hypothetical protein
VHRIGSAVWGARAALLAAALLPALLLLPALALGMLLCERGRRALGRRASTSSWPRAWSTGRRCSTRSGGAR